MMHNLLVTLMRNRIVRTVILLFISLFIPIAYSLLDYNMYLSCYDGLCGPYAPDISAFPCDYTIYVKNYSAGFRGVSLTITQLILLSFMLLLSIIIWIILEFKQRSFISSTYSIDPIFQPIDYTEKMMLNWSNPELHNNTSVLALNASQLVLAALRNKEPLELVKFTKEYPDDFDEYGSAFLMFVRFVHRYVNNLKNNAEIQ